MGLLGREERVGLLLGLAQDLIWTTRTVVVVVTSRQFVIEMNHSIFDMFILTFKLLFRNYTVEN